MNRTKTSTRVHLTWPRRVWAGLRRARNTLFLRGDLTALLLALAALIVPALAVQAAGWTTGLGQVLPVALASVMFGFLLARSHYDEVLALLMSSVYGLGVIGLTTVLNMEGGSLSYRLDALLARLGDWVNVLLNEGVSQDNLVFVIFLSTLFWYLGHNTAWHIFRVDRVWRALLPPGLVILINVFYYTGDLPLEGFMAVYGGIALLLVARSAIDAQEWEWYLRRISFPTQLRAQFLRWGAVLAVILIGAAWMLPNGAQGESLDRVQEFLNSDPLDDLNRLFNRLFASLNTEGLVTADYYGGNQLQLGGAIQLGDQPVMLVQAEPVNSFGTRFYWRSRTFSHYDGGTWTPSAAVRLTVEEPGYFIEDVPAAAGARQMVPQQFRVVLDASRLIYAAPQPSVVDLPVAIDLTYVDGFQGQADVSVIRPLTVLHTGDEYSAMSSIAVSDAPALRAAGTVYPQWVLASYLQLGNSVSQRTIDLAAQIVRDAGANTPYDQAKAIERWLRVNIVYDEGIPGAPPGADPVDWVLFEDQRGYCNYYASAMIMMLRSLGVPARMAAGFSQGEWSGASQSFLVRERDAHTWVEVYFPGTGWVEFEPTAAQAPLDRPDLSPVVPVEPSLGAPPTNTPQPTALPTATPTVVPPETPDPNAAGAPVIPPTATALPTPTPTPVVVPTIVPPQEETVPRNIAAMILSGVLTVLAILAVAFVLALVVLFVIWWVEWRGMGGLSPVQRAYALLDRYTGYLGIRLPENFTPHERRRVIADRVPQGERSVRVITQMYVDETYGPDRGERDNRWMRSALSAWRDARRAFVRTRLEQLLPRWLRRRRHHGHTRRR